MGEWKREIGVAGRGRKGNKMRLARIDRPYRASLSLTEEDRI